MFSLLFLKNSKISVCSFRDFIQNQMQAQNQLPLLKLQKSCSSWALQTFEWWKEQLTISSRRVLLIINQIHLHLLLLLLLLLHHLHHLLHHLLLLLLHLTSESCNVHSTIHCISRKESSFKKNPKFRLSFFAIHLTVLLSCTISCFSMTLSIAPRKQHQIMKEHLILARLLMFSDLFLCICCSSGLLQLVVVQLDLLSGQQDELVVLNRSSGGLGSRSIVVVFNNCSCN